jgi:hypothetical protein
VELFIDATLDDLSVFDAARNCALSEFAALTDRMPQDAERSVSQSLRVAVGERRGLLLGARQLLAEEGAILVKRLNVLYSERLERALQTMYRDLRPKLDGLSIDSLTLIDDETVNRQIDVDRIVVKLRDADPLALGRLNVTIARLHDEVNARERENPFRPYLLARTLHDVVNEIALKPSVATVLFEYLGETMLDALPAYYRAIYAVFESKGLDSRFLAVPSRFSPTATGPKARRESATLGLPSGSLGSGGTLPGMVVNTVSPDHALAWQRLLGILRPTPGQAAPSAAPADGWPQLEPVLASLPDALWHGIRKATSPAPSLSPQLLERLAACWSEVRRQPPGALPEACRLPALRERLQDGGISDAEELVLDLVGAVFAWIGTDETVSPLMRHCLTRLELPFLRAVLETPGLLLNPAHPARQLINRLGALGTGLDEQSPTGRLIVDAAMQAAIDLPDVDDVDGTLSRCLLHLEQSLCKGLRDVAPASVKCAAAVESLQALAHIRIRTEHGLRDILAPLGMDDHLRDFVVHIWSHVCTRHNDLFATTRPNAAASTAADDEAALLTELVWSLQEKSSQAEREVLLRRLPALVRRLYAMLQRHHVPAGEIRQKMDLMMEAHARILRSPPSGKSVVTPDTVRQRFIALRDDVLSSSGTDVMAGSSMPDISAADIAASLALHEADVALYAENMRASPNAPDAAGLASLSPGVGVTRRSDDAILPARLVWISADRLFYLFVPDGSGRPALYTGGTLLRSMKNGTVRLLEQMPLIERAIEGLSSTASTVR